MAGSPASLTFAEDGSAVFVDNNGYMYTAAGFDIEPGDSVGVEWAENGIWFTIGRGDETLRYPMRHGDGPHLTELTITTWPPNPFLPLVPDPTEEKP